VYSTPSKRCVNLTTIIPPKQQEAIRKLQQQRADLAAEEERSKASPAEQRDALMAKVRLWQRCMSE